MWSKLSKILRTGNLPAGIYWQISWRNVILHFLYWPIALIILLEMEHFLTAWKSSILCGFQKAHYTQHALFKLLHSWQRELDWKGFVDTILMELWKAYDSIPDDLLIAKLECYKIDKIGLSLILDYLSRHKQRTKIGSSYSSWYDIIRGAPQG